MGWEVVFWNQTPFDLKHLDYKEIKLEGKVRPSTDILKKAKITAELDHFTKKLNDPIYQLYKFPDSKSGLKSRVKSGLVDFLVKTHTSEKGLQRLRKKMKVSERKGSFYANCKKLLEQENPDLILCTNQRPVNAIAPLTAAQDLGIPTASFIFSWDNLPKATMVVETDYYFVWSEHMQKEMITYYPKLRKEQIFVTGSPQFEPHFDKRLLKTREEFFNEYGLDITKEYICFSGDDITTSPNDPEYLNDIAEAVTKLNHEGHKLGVLFRRCPTDFSNRYGNVLRRHSKLIVPIKPKWEKLGGEWNTVLPTQEDVQLQINTIAHSRAVVNVGSSMVFDFSIFNKPCLYLNYIVDQNQVKNWNPQKVYSFVHFRSMPSINSVIWLNSKEEIPSKITEALTKGKDYAIWANSWFKIINTTPPNEASIRIWNKINEL
ncbi:hypothetical protein GCM10010465_26900 [Actinomadura fibrosa]